MAVATDFFSRQETARRNTAWLIVLFLVAVAGLVGAVYLVIALAVHGSQGESLWDPSLFGVVALGTGILVGGGSAYRTASLAGGGQHVAELLGGRLVDPRTRDPDERRLLNVVEEMALASGCPVPPVYLLDQEPGINAFAAGDDPNNAVIGVTRGTLERLSRDELQGVIAHEFSHILNGDMRLNVRLMGLLFGILLISVTGWTIFRSTQSLSMTYRTRGGDRREGVNPLPLIGLGLWLLGYVGVFVGRLIKAGVSRQREYLADAAAVQFTRNPLGLAGALKKIGALEGGSRIVNPHAEEASHLFFGEALGLSGWNPLATHPPLVERIRRLDPTFDGDFTVIELAPTRSPRDEEEIHWREVTAAKVGAGPSPRGPLDGRTMAFSPELPIARLGTIEPDGLRSAARMLGELPAEVLQAVHDPLGATAVIYSLLLDPRDEAIRARQWERLVRMVPREVSETLERVAGPVAALDVGWRFPLVELAIPALKRLNAIRFREFLEVLRGLMEADRRVTLFEYALRRVLMRALGPEFGWSPRPPETIEGWEPLVESVAVVLAGLAHAGGRDAATAYARGLEALGWPARYPPLPPASEVGLREIDLALNTLSCARPRWKRSVLKACAAAVEQDGRVTVEEEELLRAISAALDCPMPLMVGGDEQG
ncbi:MAG: Zn-dependent protease [Isosphaeraceae bacterium]|nr:MAG: Zn-dependent protease [Isosphaeraceae bacterium]